VWQLGYWEFTETESVGPEVDLLCFLRGSLLLNYSCAAGESVAAGEVGFFENLHSAARPCVLPADENADEWLREDGRRSDNFSKLVRESGTFEFDGVGNGLVGPSCRCLVLLNQVCILFSQTLESLTHRARSSVEG
jgi:hypothetical protein